MRREDKLLDRKWAAILAGTVAAMLLLAATPPAYAVVGEQPVAAASATVTVPTFIEITINVSTIDFSTVNPGTDNAAALPSAGFPLALNLTANSNVNVNYTFNGSANLTSGGNSIGITNVSFNNNSTNSFETQLVFNTYIGQFGSNQSWSEYVNVPRPSSGNTTRVAYWWIDVPAGQAAGTYTSGTVNIRASRYAGP